jgi:hypothetical protein
MIILVFEQKYFFATFRELRRLGTINETPIIHHFLEIIVGFTMI